MEWDKFRVMCEYIQIENGHFYKFIKLFQSLTLLGRDQGPLFQKFSYLHGSKDL